MSGHADGATSHAAHATRALLRPMVERDPSEPHRASTPLELLFDLCFVVAVAQAASHLHHGLAEGECVHAVLNYGLVFFALWWAWMNFTWFASAFDADDVPYRLKVFVQIAGSLVIAAGIPRAFEGRDYSVVTLGYSIMRVAQIGHWLRVARARAATAQTRKTAARYGLGLVVAQGIWLAMLLLPHGLWIYAWPMAAGVEVAVPVWAERTGRTQWHPQHIAERYGLLTLIVLGECVSAATLATQAALDAGHLTPGLVALIGGGLLVAFSMWWIYFDVPIHDALTSSRIAFTWGYGHLFIFASVAAVGAGLALTTDALLGHGHATPTQVASAVALPIAVYVAFVWLLQIRAQPSGHRLAPAFLGTSALALVTIAVPAWTVLLLGVLLAALVAVLVVTRARH